MSLKLTGYNMMIINEILFEILLFEIPPVFCVVMEDIVAFVIVK